MASRPRFPVATSAKESRSSWHRSPRSRRAGTPLRLLVAEAAARGSDMNILVAAEIALGALRANRLRSALTMLGIIIGVAAVIAMVAVGSGATDRIQQQIQAIGSNLIMVIPGSITSNGIRLGSGAVVTLSEDDAKAIVAECPAVATVAPTVRGAAQV